MTGYETYLSGPRWRLPAGTIRRLVIDVNAALRKRRLLPVRLVYERRETGLLEATLFFRVEGDELSLRFFAYAFGRIVEMNNSPVPMQGFV